MPHCEGGIPISRFVAGWPQEDAIHTNHTAHIFKQNLQPNPVRIFGILQMAVATTRDGRDVVAAFFHFSKATLGFARINQGQHSSRQNEGRDMQKCREVSALTRAQPTTIVDRSCSSRGSSCAKRIAACTYPDPSCEETPQPEKLRSKLEPFLLVASV